MAFRAECLGITDVGILRGETFRSNRVCGILADGYIGVTTTARSSGGNTFNAISVADEILFRKGGLPMYSARCKSDTPSISISYRIVSIH